VNHPSETAEAGPAPAQSPGRIVAVALGLFVIGVASLPLLFVRVRASAGDLLEERFAVGELPDGLEVVESLLLPFGEQMVFLGDPGVERDRSAEEIADDVTGAGGSDEERDDGERSGSESDSTKPRFSWTSVEIGEAGALPSEVVFVWYPRRAAEQVLRSQFSSLVFRDIENIESMGGRVVIDSGKVPWGGYTTDLVLERRFKRVHGQPTFHDFARCNLTVRGSCCVLYLRWPDGRPGSRAPIERLLEAVQPRPDPSPAE